MAKYKLSLTIGKRTESVIFKKSDEPMDLYDTSEYWLWCDITNKLANKLGYIDFAHYCLENDDLNGDKLNVEKISHG